MSDIEFFLKRSSEILFTDKRVIALCAAGSWITNEIDEFSDLDLVIVTNTDITDSKTDMVNIASLLGSLTSGFTGEHVGEKRLLICLYQNPVIHVDLKFVPIEDFSIRVENPVIIWEKDKSITELYNTTTPKWPLPDYQWIEDRFWVWIHYVAAKTGRGELFEAIEFISFLRNTVIGPMYHLKYKTQPRGVRKMEFILNNDDLDKLKTTIPEYSSDSVKSSIKQIISLYKELREILFDTNVIKRIEAEKVSILYMQNIFGMYI
jgi:hypothetical protein